MHVAPAVEVRLLFESDMASAMRLKDAAGWNQTEADWLRLLSLQPNGCFCAVKDGHVVGTTTTTTYGADLAWIGMVLVDPDHRGQGIATKLMKVAMEYLHDQVRNIKLDATAQGKPLYERFGFAVESMLVRWIRNGTATAAAPRQRVEMARADLRNLLVFDRRAFSADRSELIVRLINEAWGAPVLTRNTTGALSGYALARQGTKADYIGPLVVEDRGHVETILDELLNRLPGQSIYIDVNTEFSVSANVLSDRGFVKERDLIRMTTRSSGPKTSPLVFAIAGPEIG